MAKGSHNNHASSGHHYRWNNSKMVTSHGYVKIRVGRSHPLADSNGYAYEHLVVWVSSGQPKPSKGYVIHHINSDKTDNRIENLELKSRRNHNRIHNQEKTRNQLGQFVGKKEAGRLLDGREWNQFPKP